MLYLVWDKCSPYYMIKTPTVDFIFKYLLRSLILEASHWRLEAQNGIWISIEMSRGPSGSGCCCSIFLISRVHQRPASIIHTPTNNQSLPVYQLTRSTPSFALLDNHTKKPRRWQGVQVKNVKLRDFFIDKWPPGHMGPSILTYISVFSTL